MLTPNASMCYSNVNSNTDDNERGWKTIARKTTTSTDVKRRYNEKTYKRIYLQLPNELVDAFKEKCKKLNISQASVLKDAIEKFLGE